MKIHACVSVALSQHYAIDLIMTWNHGLMEYEGRIICNAKDDQVVVDQFVTKHTSDMLKKNMTAVVPHKFDAARRRNSTAPGSNALHRLNEEVKRDQCDRHIE
jgi:hypothetical protein